MEPGRHSPHRHPAALRALLCAGLCLQLAAACGDDAHQDHAPARDTHQPGDLAPADLASDSDGNASDGEALDGDDDAPELTPPPPSQPPWLRDADGGVRILRGTNLSQRAKAPPDFQPEPDELDFVRLRDELGFSAVRLLVFWEAIEPMPGQYDADYLAAVRARVAAAGAAGLHVVLDMHQDVFGRGFGHAGAPRWACDEALYASFEPPEDWFAGYFTPEVQACFDHLWQDEALRAAFAAAWQQLARAVHDVPGLLAYDLFNEPFWGTSPLLRFERSVLPAFYQASIDAIREVDPATAIGIEPSPLVNLGLATELVAPDDTHLVYMPHIYPPALELGEGYDGDAAALAGQVDDVARDGGALGLPLLVGELGARAEIAGSSEFLRDLYDALDAEMLGALQWEGGHGGYGLWLADGAPSSVALAIARPYPTRIAGEPLGWSWDASAGVFTARWREDGSATGPTRIALPRLAFPDGAQLTLDGAPGEPVSAGTAELVIEQTGAERTLELRAR